MGFESGNQEVLDAISKKMTVTSERRFMQDARRAGILIHGCFRVGFPGETRAGMEQTLALALELAPHNVRCNAICPGAFLTEINKPLLKEPEKAKMVVGLMALNRWGELHEIRGAALFLASDASTFVTGSSLYVDAGWTAK